MGYPDKFKFIKKFDEEFVRLGSSLIGVNTQYSDFDYAVPISIWKRMYPLLKDRYGFSASKGSSSSGSATDPYASRNRDMFNKTNLKMSYQGMTFDFIIYDDDLIDLVRTAADNFVDFVSGFTDKEVFRDKNCRIDTFQYFLKKEFGVATNESKAPASELDDLFDEIKNGDEPGDENFFDELS